MGTTEKDWQALGRACLLALRPDLATAAYLRSRDARMLHACACLAQKKAQGQPDDHLHAYALALLVSRLLLNDTAFQFIIREQPTGGLRILACYMHVCALRSRRHRGSLIFTYMHVRCLVSKILEQCHSSATCPSLTHSWKEDFMVRQWVGGIT